MAPFLLKRIFHGVAVLWVVATLTFVLLRLTPGGPFDRERKLPPQVVANLELQRLEVEYDRHQQQPV